MKGAQAILVKKNVGPLDVAMEGLWVCRQLERLKLGRNMVVSQNRGCKYRSQYVVVLIIGTSRKGTPNFGKPPNMGPGPLASCCANGTSHRLRLGRHSAELSTRTWRSFNRMVGSESTQQIQAKGNGSLLFLLFWIRRVTSPSYKSGHDSAGSHIAHPCDWWSDSKKHQSLSCRAKLAYFDRL